jgi:hypothetical protein
VLVGDVVVLREVLVDVVQLPGFRVKFGQLVGADRLTADLVSMKAAPEGPAGYYIRTSASAQTPLDLSLLAATRLLQRSHPRTREVLAAVHDQWYEVLRSAVGDPAVARLIMLIGDGMYYGATLSGAEPGPSAAAPDVGEVLELIDVLVRLRDASGTSGTSH